MPPEDNPADNVQPSKEEWDGYVAGKEPRKQSMLYEICPHCEGKGGEQHIEGASGHGIPCCKMLGVVETGATAGQLRYMAGLDNLRQEAGISAGMLRDGRAALLRPTLIALYAWQAQINELMPKELGEQVKAALGEDTINRILGIPDDDRETVQEGDKWMNKPRGASDK